MFKIITPWSDQGAIPPYDWHSGYVGRCCAADEVDTEKDFQDRRRGLVCFISKNDVEYSPKENEWFEKVSLVGETLYVKGATSGERSYRGSSYVYDPGKNQPESPYASVFTDSSLLDKWLEEAKVRNIFYIFSITGKEGKYNRDTVFYSAGYSKHYVSPLFCNLQYSSHYDDDDSRLKLTIWKRD